MVIFFFCVIFIIVNKHIFIKNPIKDKKHEKHFSRKHA